MWIRVISHMPNFYNHSDTKEFGKITVTPRQWWRRIRIGSYSIWPYVTMGKIEFTLRVEKLPQSDGINKRNRNVYIRLGNGSYRSLKTLAEKSTPIEGIAEYTGDTKFFIAPSNYSVGNSDRFIDKEGILLFDDNVLSVNHYVWGGCSVAALLLILCSVVLSLLSGLIQVNPERVIWWPW